MSNQQTDPVVSILMVNWNTREMTLACLASLYAETRAASFEVILVDNGSGDGSADAIRAAYPQVRLLAETVNHGFAKANNIAAEKAKGRYLLLLNTDTVVQNSAVDQLVSFADANPAAGIWGGRTIFADGTLNPTSVWGRITPWSAITFALGLSRLFSNSSFFNPEGFGNWRRDSVRHVDIVSGCFFLIERDFWNRLNGFDPAFFMYGEEADLCARAHAEGAKPLMTPDAQIIHYGGASSARFSNKIVYIFGARMGLVQRQYQGPAGAIARGATRFGAFWRAKAYTLAAAFSSKPKWKSAASEWAAAWDRRASWQNGPYRPDDSPIHVHGN